MIEYTLNIGELVATNQKNVTYTCLGLGSCIGLFLHDRTTGITGGAHIMLPDGETSLVEDGKFFTADSAMSELLARFKEMGSSLQTLRAKITGGANVIESGYEIGSKNIASVVGQLINNKVFIAAKDIGGTHSRTARFHSASGTLMVHVAQTKECKIY
jgi:chemotaxis protein CheD